jgi:type IV secretory pathway VirB10-like protein
MREPCAQCGAPLDERQTMCIECGAVLDPGPRRRLRNVLPTGGLAVLALIVTASAAYAVTTDLRSKPDSSTSTLAAAPPPAAPAAPAPAPPPASTTTTPPPAATPPPAPAKPAAPPTAPAPKASAPAPSASPSTSTHSSSPSTTHHHSGATKRHHHTTPSILAAGDQPYQAALYDPYPNGVDEHGGDAPLAVDGKQSTAWTTGAHPGGLNKPGVGLVVDTGGYQNWSAMGILTKTPGFDVSIYSTDQADAPQGGPAAAGWKLEGRKSSVAKEQRIALKGASSQPQHFLVWITKLPAGRSTAGLSEIALLP